MQSTAPQTEQEEKEEYFDNYSELDQKITLLAEAIKKSKHFVVFTGEGIQTSDFRNNIYTCRVRKKDLFEKEGQQIPETHMAIIELTKRGILKFVISQNVDGLHRRSGLNPELLAELHGNNFLQKCLECQRQYFRDQKCRGKREKPHQTGRKCECGGDLADSIIHVGENLPQKELFMGHKHSEIADLHLCLGSSLRASPENDMPFQTVKNGGQLFIVNLQKTPLEDKATNIFAACDQVMQLLMKKLEIPIPEFEPRRNFQIQLEKEKYVVFQSTDIDGNPCDLFEKIKVVDSVHKTFILDQKPFVLDLGFFKGGLLKLDLLFLKEFDWHNWYNRHNCQNLELVLESDSINQYEPLLFKLAFNLWTKQWRTLN